MTFLRMRQAFFGWISLGFFLLCCSTLPTPQFRAYSFPSGKAFLAFKSRVELPYEVLGMVRSKVHFSSLDPQRDEAELCANYFNQSVQQLVQYAQKKGGDAVIEVQSVVFLADGRQELYSTPECSDDGSEGQILSQGMAIRWKKTAEAIK